jgi:RimJ/RimL family protein N-acetyltransferase
VWSWGIEGFYLVGNVRRSSFSEQLDSYVREAISPRARSLGLSWFELSTDRPESDQAVAQIFASREIQTESQCVYLPAGSALDAIVAQSPAGGEDVRPLDAAFLAEARWQNRGFLESKLDQFWGDHEAFLSNGVGYAVVHEEAIAALCFSAFVAGPVHAIDIETTPAARRKGFARSAAMAFLAECSRRGLRPHWDCMAENAASRALAEGLGFRLAREYPLYSFRLD